ncbi:MAG: 50S ribosomal protein L4 [bacterium]
MPEVNLYNIKGENLGKVKLEDAIFAPKVNKDLLHEAVTMYLANKRKGLASTKTRGEVSGGGAKPWKQKGTGRARAGSNRSPIWRHGGTTFGPKPRDYSYTMPKKKKKLALKGALSAKLKDKGIVVLESLDMVEPKTKFMYRVLDKLHATDRALLVVTEVTDSIRRFSQNIKALRVCTVKTLNAYDVLDSHKIIIARDAVQSLEDFFKVKA